MPVIRQYVMIAAQGREEAMCSALVELAGKVRPIDGCEGVELYQDPSKPTDFLFLERWTSVDQHKAGGRQLGKEALSAVMAAIAHPPEGRYLQPVTI